MFNSQVYRQLWLGAVAAGFITMAGCSNQPANEAAKPKNAATATAKKTEPAKVVAASAKVTQEPQLVTVPKGMAITATVGQTLSNKNKPGDSFAARLSAPLQVDGKTVIPKGARLTGHVVTVKKNELKVTLASVTLHGKSYDLETNSIRPPKPTPAKSTDKKSAKASTASKDTKDKNKKDVTTVPAQTQLTFKLAKPVTVPVRG
jgi:outer membrane murein-binding lipoprotein Lpp